MPKAGRHTGPTHVDPAAAAHDRWVVAAEARQAALGAPEVDVHHRDVRWVLETAIGYAVAGDDDMAEFTIRHAVHVGVPVVELAGALADIGYLRAGRT
jgi:hypothetical protein